MKISWSYQEFSHEIQEKIRNCTKSGKIRNNQENHEGLDGLQLTKMHMFACMLYNYAFVDMTETDRHGFKITFTKVNLKG